MDHDPYHAGEQALQAQVGVRERMADIGSRVVRDRMPDQHREFFAKLPFVVVGSVDAAGQPQASALAGPPGFIRSPDPRRLVIRARPHPGDPLAGRIMRGTSLGLLGIEPHTRRRNRMNGLVENADADGFSIVVQQSYGNCPRYIHSREARWDASAAARPTGVTSMTSPDLASRLLIATADTCFIATAHPDAATSEDPAHGVDVSHRGGRPGFVRSEEQPDGTLLLTMPDYSGNLMFNTLGNLMLNPRAGLLFIDHARGDTLHLSCDTDVVSNGKLLDAYPQAERLIRFRVRCAVRITASLGLGWREGAPSPFTPVA